MTYLTLAEVEALARHAHRDQVDKAGRPYEEHLAAVAHGVERSGGDEEQIAAAWLHDAIEDDALSREWLAEAPLSPRTKELVLAMTKRPGEDPRDYAARLRAVPGATEIKVADMEHNRNPARLAVLDPATRVRLRQKYARMRRLLFWDPQAEATRPERPCEGDPGNEVLLAQLKRDQHEAWRQLADAVRKWRVEDGDYTWSDSGPQPNGTFRMGYPVYSERVDALIGALVGVGAVTPAYHWMDFPVPQLSWDDAYTPGDAVRATTAVVRGERFSDGTIGTAYEDGTLYAIVSALVAWHGTAPQGTQHEVREGQG